MPLSRTNTNQSCSNLHALSQEIDQKQKTNSPPASPSAMTKASSEIAASFADSPEQQALNYFLQVDYKQGYKPNDAQRVWMGMRKLTTQMNTLEKANSEIGRTVSSADYISSARDMAKFIGKLVSTLPARETQHPGFRKELRYHMGKMCEWNPHNKATWSTAYEHLDRSESIQVEGELYDKRACLAKAAGVTLRKYHP